MAMKISTIFYLLKEGFANLFRNRLLSVAAITTISACIFVISIFYVVGANIEYMLDAVEQNMGITVFFEFDTQQERIDEIRQLFEARSEVHSVEYISPEEAWNTFKNNYFEGKEDQLSGFEGDNPLKDSASLVIYFEDLDTQQDLAAYAESIPDVRYIRQSEQVVSVMQSVSQLVSYSSLILIVILVIISVFLISNVVRLGISTRSKEIVIMKYIGAKDSFVKGPFFTEGVLIGVIGTVIPLVIIYFFYNDVTVALVNQFAILKSYLVFVDLRILYTKLIPITAGVGIGIGLLGSWFTVGRFLKV